MGTISFTTTVTKTLDLDKAVTLDVDKSVESRVVLAGNLATSEASADAIGFEGNLAETETFTQIASSSAFSFSDSLAAGSASTQDAPPVLDISDSPARAEGDAGATVFSFTVTRTGDLSGESTVDWTVSGIGADPANPADFVGGVFPGGMVTFAAGADTAMIEVEVQGDTDIEPDEGFAVTLSDPVGATLGDGTGESTILNDDVPLPPPVLDIADSPARAEGDAGATVFSFTVTRTGDLSGESTVDWTVSGIGADPANPADFVGGVFPGGMVTFAAGADTAMIEVEVQGDTDIEPDEGFAVTLSDPVGATLGDGTGESTILNDDVPLPPPVLDIADSPARAEGDAGATVFSFTVTRTGDLSGESTVDWTVSGIGADPANPADFVGGVFPGGMVTFAAGADTAMIEVPVQGDTDIEPDEGFAVTLSDPVGAALGDGTGESTILNDDVPLPPPVLDIADSPARAEGDAGATVFSFTVTRTGDLSGESTVDWTVSGIGADPANPADFVGGVFPGGMVTFAAGADTAMIEVEVQGDTDIEPDEGFAVTLSDPVGATLGDGTGESTILNDDVPLPPPVLDISDSPARAEGDAGATVFSFTVTRTGDLSGESTVDWTVSGIGADPANPADFVGGVFPGGMVTFAAGADTAMIEVEVQGDTDIEPDEGFAVTLSDPVGATLGDGTGESTILNDDVPLPPPVLDIADSPARAEGDAGATVFSFTVTRTGDLSGESTVDWTVSGIGADPANPADFVGGVFPGGMVTFAAGADTAMIEVEVQGDTDIEPDEGFAVTLSDPVGATLGDGTGESTILNDDVPLPPPVLDISDSPDRAEGDAGATVFSFTVTRTGDLSGESTVDWTVSGIGADPANPADFVGGVFPGGMVTFAAGADTAMIEVEVQGDTDIEPDEGFAVTLSDPVGATLGDGTGESTILNDDREFACGWSWGDPHYRTLDGVAYDFQGLGEFILVESTDNDDIVVQTRTSPWNYNLSVNSAVATELGGISICIDTADEDVLRIAGDVEVFDGLVDIGDGTLEVQGNSYTVTYNNGEILKVVDYGNHLGVTFCAKDERDPGTLRGLLGNFDGDASNDLMTRDGSAEPFTGSISFGEMYGVFADSWRITQEESLLCYDEGETTETFTDRDFPRRPIARDDLPPDKVAEAIDLLDAAGVTDPVLREAAIIDYAATCDPTYIDSVAVVESPTDTIEVTDVTTIWTNGGQVVIGSEISHSSFDVGTAGTASAGDLWSDGAASDNWSDDGNWNDGTAPTDADGALFSGLGGGLNIVDADFEVASLQYDGTGNHTTDLAGTNALNVSGAVQLFVEPSEQRHTLIVRDGTEVVANVGAIRVGFSDSGSDTISGNLVLQTGAELEASDAGTLSIGETGNTGFNAGSSADGSLTVASNTALHIGSAGAPAAALNIGYHASSADGTAAGLLDASDDAATVEIDVVDLTVGRGTSATRTGIGELRWNQTEALLANTVYFSLHSGGSGTLDTRAGETVKFGTAADQVQNFRIAYNLVGSGVAEADIDLSVEDPFFEAHIAGTLSIGETGNTGFNAGSFADGSLTVASNTALHIGSAGAPAAALNIGYHASSADGTAAGLLDASDDAATVEIDVVDLTVGRGTSATRTGIGELRWNQTEALLANTVYFSLHSGGSGTLDTRAGETVKFGTAADQVQNFRIAYNLVGSGVAEADIDLSVEDPFFEAHIAGTLSIGETGNTGFNAGSSADGSLTVASNTALHIGSAGAPAAALNIGYHASSADGTAAGLLDASDDAATVEIDVVDLTVGRGTSATRTGIGELRWNQTEALLANTVYFSLHSGGSGTLDTRAGETVKFGTAADQVQNFRIAYNLVGSGVAEADIDLSVEDPFFEAHIAGTLSIGETGNTGFNAGSSADGSLTVASNTALHIGSAGAPAAALNIGYHASSADGTAAGLLDASDDAATVEIDVVDLTVGRGTSATRTGIGELRWNQTEALLANTVYFSLHSGGSGTLDTRAGETVKFGTAADQVQNFRIAYNLVGSGVAEADIDLSVEDPFFEAHIAGTLSIGETGNTGFNAGSFADGSLTVASNTALHIGSAGAPAAALNIGYHASSADGTAAGLLDASDDAATVEIDVVDLTVGRGTSATRTGIGELRWNQTEALLANTVYFSLHSGGSGTLDTRAGETVKFGTAADQVQNFRIAYNLVGSGVAEADIDLSVEDPFFEAHIAGTLSIGETGNTGFNAGSFADGSLTVASNTTLHIGSAGAPAAALNIGYHASSADGTAAGLLDASDDAATVEIDVVDLTVGRGTSATRTGIGELRLGDGASLSAINANVGMGDGSSGTIDFGDRTLDVGDDGNLHIVTLNFSGGLITGGTLRIGATGTFNFSGGTLAVDNVDHLGGVLDLGSLSDTILNGDYSATSAALLEIEIASGQHDVLVLNGTIDLDSDSGGGAVLDPILGSDLSLGDDFVFIDNDGADAVSGRFQGLEQGDTLEASFAGTTYVLEIDYFAGDGNDVGLTVFDIA